MRDEKIVETAAALGISRSHLNNIELGKDQPGRELLLAMAAHFGRTLDWLASGKEGLKAGAAQARDEGEALWLYVYREAPQDEVQTLLKMLLGRIAPPNNLT